MKSSTDLLDSFIQDEIALRRMNVFCLDRISDFESQEKFGPEILKTLSSMIVELDEGIKEFSKEKQYHSLKMISNILARFHSCDDIYILLEQNDIATKIQEIVISFEFPGVMIQSARFLQMYSLGKKDYMKAVFDESFVDHLIDRIADPNGVYDYSLSMKSSMLGITKNDLAYLNGDVVYSVRDGFIAAIYNSYINDVISDDQFLKLIEVSVEMLRTLTNANNIKTIIVIIGLCIKKRIGAKDLQNTILNYIIMYSQCQKSIIQSTSLVILTEILYSIKEVAEIFEDNNSLEQILQSSIIMEHIDIDGVETIRYHGDEFVLESVCGFLRVLFCSNNPPLIYISKKSIYWPAFFMAVGGSTQVVKCKFLRTIRWIFASDLSLIHHFVECGVFETLVFIMMNGSLEEQTTIFKCFDVSFSEFNHDMCKQIIEAGIINVISDIIGCINNNQMAWMCHLIRQIIEFIELTSNPKYDCIIDSNEMQMIIEELQCRNMPNEYSIIVGGINNVHNRNE